MLEPYITSVSPSVPMSELADSEGGGPSETYDGINGPSFEVGKRVGTLLEEVRLSNDRASDHGVLFVA